MHPRFGSYGLHRWPRLKELLLMTRRQKLAYVIGVLGVIAFGATVLSITLGRLFPRVPYVSLVGPLVCVAAVILFMRSWTDR